MGRYQNVSLEKPATTNRPSKTLRKPREHFLLLQLALLRVAVSMEEERLLA